jgi:PadR family transcriptional regulator
MRKRTSEKQSVGPVPLGVLPALQRLLLRAWVKAAWGTSENNRRARYYTLSASGRKQLNAERAEFDRIVVAIHKVLATS